VVADVLAAAGLTDVPVRPALCFLGVEWPLLFTPRNAGGVELLSLRRLARLTGGTPVLSVSQIKHLEVTLDRELRPAAATTTPPSTSAPGSGPTASSRSRAAEPTDATAGDVTVKPWKRHGEHRLYVNAPDGTTMGYVDMQSNAVVPTDERNKESVRDAVARFLRES
jgi:hypothetical protein